MLISKTGNGVSALFLCRRNSLPAYFLCPLTFPLIVVIFFCCKSFVASHLREVVRSDV